MNRGRPNHRNSVSGLCDGNSPVTGEFPSQRPVTRSFDVFFYLCLNERLCKQSRRRWFEKPSRSLCPGFHLNCHPDEVRNTTKTTIQNLPPVFCKPLSGIYSITSATMSMLTFVKFTKDTEWTGIVVVSNSSKLFLSNVALNSFEFHKTISSKHLNIQFISTRKMWLIRIFKK